MVIAAVGTVLAAGYLLWLYQRTSFGTPTEEFADEHIHDVHVTEWIAWLPMLVLDPRARHLPEHHLPRHRPDRSPRWARPSRRWASSRPCSRPSSSRAPFDSPDGRLPHARARDRAHRRHRRRAAGRPVHARRARGASSRQLAGIGHPRRAGPGAHAGRRRRRPRDVRRRLHRRQLRARAQGDVPAVGLRRRAAVHQLHRRGRLRRGRVLLPAAVVAPRHGRDGVAPATSSRSSSPSSCCRSPPTCSPAGASATCTATRRA